MDGKITITRTTDSQQDKDFMRLYLRDVKSAKRILTIEMTLENFALAVTNMSEIPCEFTLSNIENTGKQRETKTFRIKTDKMFVLPTERLEALHKEGWEPVLSSKQDGRNYKINSDPNDPYTYTANILFERFL